MARTTAKHLAAALDADERTVRRAIEQGTVHAKRSSPRRLEVSDAEDRYLRRHWRFLEQLRAVLRTEPNVRVAVMFGSLARGDERPDSDVDLLVELGDDSWGRRQGLNTRLERALGRPVELVVLERVAQDNPSVLLEALREGRVVADRGDRWRDIKRKEPSLRRSARERANRDRDETRNLVDEVIRS
jgi:predicted nucleotidyltransferase